MNQAQLLLVFLCLSTINSAVVLNPITGITTKNLMYTGTIAVDAEKLFFTFYGFDGETNPDNLSQKTLIIAVGTPARSSQYINLASLGPKILMESTLSDNPNRATAFANILFLDCLGSGFSFASSASAIPKTMKDHATIVTKAINSFTSQTNIGKSKSLYIVGESTWIRAVVGMGDVTGLEAMVYLAPWFDFYAIGKEYGTAGLDMKIFTNSEKVTIQSTFSTCYTLQRNNKSAEAHNCYDVTLNYIESKTKTRNLYNIKKQSNWTEFLPMIQYYFSQPSTVTLYKAPSTSLFQSQSSQTYYNIYQDQGKNVDEALSKYMKDNYYVKQIFVTGDDDFICYRKPIRNWLENTLVFTESAKFKPLNLTEYSVGDKVVGYRKAVTQVAYYELLNSGHFMYNDQASVVNAILSDLSSGKLQMNQSDSVGIRNIRGGANQHQGHKHGHIIAQE